MIPNFLFSEDEPNLATFNSERRCQHGTHIKIELKEWQHMDIPTIGFVKLVIVRLLDRLALD